MMKKLFKFLIFNKINLKIKRRSEVIFGFTLIELLISISVIGFLAMSTVVVLNIIRRNARDTRRVASVNTIKKSLDMYLNDSTSGYPISSGECLTSSSGVGATLKSANVLLIIPADPLWPTSIPNPAPTPTPPYTTDSDGFCFYYVATSPDNKTQFQIYYYLESNSKAGNAGPNLITQ